MSAYLFRKSQSFKVYALFRGQNIGKALIEPRVDKISHPYGFDIGDLIRSRTVSHAKYLALFGQYQNIGSQNGFHRIAYIVKGNFAAVLAVKYGIDLSCIVKESD